MSDGMSDASAHGRQAQRVNDAAYALAKALKDATDGVRGWAISRLELEDIVNGYLEDENVPFRLHVRNNQR
jgi:hypothetical protein